MIGIFRKVGNDLFLLLHLTVADLRYLPIFAVALCTLCFQLQLFDPGFGTLNLLRMFFFFCPFGFKRIALYRQVGYFCGQDPYLVLIIFLLMASLSISS